MNKTALEIKKLDQEKTLKEKEIDQKEKASKREMGPKWLSAATKFVKQDSTWYKQYIKDLDKFFNIPTYTRVGDPVNKFNISDSDIRSVAGICVIPFVHTLGFTDGRKDNPANKGYVRLLTEMRKANSRIGNYDPSDISLYVNAVADLIENIHEAIRATKLLNTFDPVNTFLNKDLIEALGFDPDQALNDKAEIIMELDVLINDFNKNIPAPKQISLFERKKFLGSTIFKDSKVRKSQYYAYRNEYLCKYDDENNRINYTKKSSIYRNLLSFIKGLQDCITALQDTTTMIELLSDIRTGFSTNDYIIIESPEMKASFDFALSDEVLGQINNTVSIPDFLDDPDSVFTDQFDIKIGSNGYPYQGLEYNASYPNDCGLHLHMTPNMSASSTGTNRTVYTNPLINMYKDEVTGDDILVNTRNIPVINLPYTSAGSEGYTTCSVQACSTELILRFELYYKTREGILGKYAAHSMMNIDSGMSPYNIARILTIASQFDWMPRIAYVDEYIYSEGAGGYLLTMRDVTTYLSLYEVANYFPISNDNLIKLHSACLSSLLFVNTDVFTKVH